MSQPLFCTTDLALATTLSIWHTLELIKRETPHKVQFVFKNNPDIEKTITEYWQGKLLVEPQLFYNKLKSLKTRLYEEVAA